jgi:hypothetical protein
MAPFDDLCATTPEVGVFNPVVEWHKDTWSMGANSRSSVSAPVVAQLTDDNGDGEITPDDMPEVLLITYNPRHQTSCWLRAVSGDGATEVLNVQNAQFSRNQNLSVADIDNDGVVEIVTKARDQKVYAYEHDGALKWTSAALGANTGAADSVVSISDMNGDGNPELVTGRAILDQRRIPDLDRHPSGIGGAVSMSFAVDVDGDGEQEVVVGNALYNIAGADLWYNGETDGYPAIIDLELDGQPEIVVVPPSVRTQRGTDGTVVWDVAVPGGRGGPPTVADFDGDGMPEIGIAGGQQIQRVRHGRHRPVERRHPGRLLRRSPAARSTTSRATASPTSSTPTRSTSTCSPATTAPSSSSSPRTTAAPASSMPVIADVDGDGQVEIAFVSESYGGQFGTTRA